MSSSKFIAIALLTTQLLQLTLFAPSLSSRALAETSPTPGKLRYTLSAEIPEHGALDLYHNAYARRDNARNSLYALRNTAVEHLLNSRGGIKTLLGGTRRARKVVSAQRARSLSFDVPAGTIDLYLVGSLGAPSNVSGSGGGDSARSERARAPIDMASSPQIAGMINALSETEPKFDEKQREDVLLKLAHISAQLTRYDQQLAFLARDYWSAPGVKREMSALARRTALNTQQLRDSVLKQHGMQATQKTLAAQREYLLDRFHLLETEIGGRPLYQSLYAAMQSVGFPRADLVQKPVTDALPEGKNPIALPSEFDQAMNRAYEVIETSADEARVQMVAELKLGTSDLLDQALIAALDANTAQLERLTREIHFSGDANSPLLELATYDDLWNDTVRKYQYLSGVIDFNDGRARLNDYFKNLEEIRQAKRYARYGVGIGMGVVGMSAIWAPVLSGGAAATSYLGIPVRAWLVGSGLLTTAQARYDYSFSKTSAETARGLFSGTFELGSHQRMKDAVLMADHDYSMLIASLVGLGLDANVMAALSVGRKVIVAGGKKLIQVSREEVELMRYSVGKLAARGEKLAPMGRALSAAARGLLGIPGMSQEHVMSIVEAMPLVAKRAGISTAEAWNRIKANPSLGPLLKRVNAVPEGLATGWKIRDRSAQIMGKPSMFQTLLSQEANNFTVSLATEYAARGDKMFGSELGDFANDMTQGALITFALVYIGAPIAPAAQAEFNNTASSAVQVTEGFAATPLGRALSPILSNAKSNFMVGLAINSSTTAFSESLRIRDKEGDMTFKDATEAGGAVLKNGLWGATTLGISSTLRYRFFAWLEGAINRHLTSDPHARILIQGAWTGNNLFGGWSYVKMGQATGFLDGGDAPVAANPAENYPDGMKMEIENLGDAYLKVDADLGTAGYVFDFLRQGDAAGEVPILR
jgi:hypothetical protein